MAAVTNVPIFSSKGRISGLGLRLDLLMFMQMAACQHWSDVFFLVHYVLKILYVIYVHFSCRYTMQDSNVDSRDIYAQSTVFSSPIDVSDRVRG